MRKGLNVVLRVALVLGGLYLLVMALYFGLPLPFGDWSLPTAGACVFFALVCFLFASVKRLL